MTFIPPTDNDAPSKGRAAVSFLIGLASFGTGALAGTTPAADGRATTEPRSALGVNLAMLACYAALVAGPVVGWQVEPSLFGIAVGLFLAAGVIVVIAVVMGVVDTVRDARTGSRPSARPHG